MVALGLAVAVRRQVYRQPEEAAVEEMRKPVWGPTRRPVRNLPVVLVLHLAQEEVEFRLRAEEEEEEGVVEVAYLLREAVVRLSYTKGEISSVL